MMECRYVLPSSVVLASAIFLLFLSQGCLCLRNVTLLISPQAVNRGQDVTLYCNYDLEKQPLYSVKWYRGKLEFYRYSPGDSPTSKIFPYPGIDVDVSRSNATQVVLRKVDFNMSGNLSCEVTTDYPSFSTKLDVQRMMVMELPEKGPVLMVNQKKFDTNELLQANCTSVPSKPAATLSFHLNNVPVGDPNDTWIQTFNDSLQSSHSLLRLRLKEYHFTRDGHMVLKCTAVISTLYRNSSEVQLISKAKEPVPERVTSPSSGSSLSRFPRHHVSSLVLTLVTFLVIHHR
uniref:Ig-like domain-containing protein n=1 Tax=Cacopsylla melanoneura TaxID=428564 RepID=A0A8D8VIH2_9HEMI